MGVWRYESIKEAVLGAGFLKRSYRMGGHVMDFGYSLKLNMYSDMIWSAVILEIILM